MTKVRGPLLFPCLWRVFVSILFIVPQLHWTESTDPYPYLVSFLMLIKLSAFSQCLQHLSCSIICPRSTILLPFFQLWSLFPSKDAASTSTVSETSGKKNTAPLPPPLRCQLNQQVYYCSIFVVEMMTKYLSFLAVS